MTDKFFGTHFFYACFIFHAAAAFLSFTSLANPQLGYIGLTPRQYSSGKVDRHGSISKMGPAECRSMLYEAAQTMLTVTKRTFKLKNWGCEEKRNEKSNCSSSKKISCNYA
ncbi:hypothetical protein CLD06_04095 [Wolbachia endosymbiont of Drosophila subpulchrella]|nr:IS110 family transposase [Wolbachia endosymbiont of Nasonia oneida]NGZ20251.1 IS110 family transposase [Wolbachia pipientis]PBD15810.1 hypothetical protein CLD06_04095 [Wolbachia endosymbiont of Drosophila subpulchrella]TLW86565.1 IS110 family transposase [Wolbachia endosymbiont of Drosophila teissieri]